MFGKIERSADPRFFCFGFFFQGGGGNTAQRHDVIFSCRQLAQESLAKSLFSPAHKGVFEPSPPRPSVSGSLPLPCPLKTSNVFFTQLCAGLCVQACVAFPLTRIQSQQHTHTHTHTHTRTHTPSFYPQACAHSAAAAVVVVALLLTALINRTQVCSSVTCENTLFLSLERRRMV